MAFLMPELSSREVLYGILLIMNIMRKAGENPMGFFKNMMKKANSIPLMEEPTVPYNEKASQLYEELKKRTERPMIHFQINKTRQAGLFDCKIKGAYYIPPEDSVPVNKRTGKELYLLVQINFEQLPLTPDLPQTGLLQIFIAGDDDIYGLDLDDPTKQEGWCIRYLKEIPDEESVSDDTVHDPCWNDTTCLPFTTQEVYRLEPVQKQAVITYCDYRTDSLLEEICRELYQEEITDIYDLPEECSDVLVDLLVSDAVQMLGYPMFTQEDPHQNMKNPNHYDTLLFQLDVIEDIMWGDSGVANFFINSEDLRRGNFQDVWYNWDCC